MLSPQEALLRPSRSSWSTRLITKTIWRTKTRLGPNAGASPTRSAWQRRQSPTEIATRTSWQQVRSRRLLLAAPWYKCSYMLTILWWSKRINRCRESFKRRRDSSVATEMKLWQMIRSATPSTRGHMGLSSEVAQLVVREISTVILWRMRIQNWCHKLWYIHLQRFIPSNLKSKAVQESACSESCRIRCRQVSTGKKGKIKLSTSA